MVKDFRVEKILLEMTLEEKIGQMIQANKLSIDKHPEHIQTFALGSILSGGGEAPQDNSFSGWQNMIENYQSYAKKTRLKIPLLYGVDAVHGHGNLKGATIFPHNIGLGASRDEDLVQKIGEGTAIEVSASGANWNFAPAVSVPHDIRWGRTFEGYSEDPVLVSKLGAAYVRGMRKADTRVIGSVKHFVGDGGTVWGTSQHENFKIDQGDTILDETVLRQEHMSPYLPVLAAGIETVMASYSSWNGQKMHGHHYLLSEVLKKDLDFKGFVVSDWLGVFQLPGAFDEQIEASINAGIDMIMAVDLYRDVFLSIKRLVDAGRISKIRIDNAVRRILRIKSEIGLLEGIEYPRPYLKNQQAHRNLARIAVQKSAVLLKNSGVLPLSVQAEAKTLMVVGNAADDLGMQCGGWTLNWQGHHGKLIPGQTLLDALKMDLDHTLWSLSYIAEPSENKSVGVADVSIVVIGEEPYAEGFGDAESLDLNAAQLKAIYFAKEHSRKVILIIYSGRPLILGDIVEQVDAIVAAWLPGSEGRGLVDLLMGSVNFSGLLPVTWPKTLVDYKGQNIPADKILFPFGFGLTY